MKPIVKICSTDNNSIIITDLTQDSDEYVDEDIVDAEAYYEKNKFKYSETCTINFISKTTVSPTEEEEIYEPVFTDHNSYLDEIHYKLNQDGFYTVYHIILPTTEWLNKELEKAHSILKSDIEIYVCDCSNIYKYSKGNLHKIEDVDILTSVNTENTTISRTVVNQFSIYDLYKCYITLCKQIFQNTTFKCFDKINLEDITFKRDFIWMTINIIKYYTEMNNFLEAQRLLQKINYCGGICNEKSLSKQNNSGCGCNK